MRSSFAYHKENRNEEVFHMLDRQKILDRIDNMPPEELARIVEEALEESGIPYTEGEGGGIMFDGFNLD